MYSVVGFRVLGFLVLGPCWTLGIYGFVGPSEFYFWDDAILLDSHGSRPVKGFGPNLEITPWVTILDLDILDN